MYIRSVHPLVTSFCLCATVFRQISLLKCIQDVHSYLGSCWRTNSSHNTFRFDFERSPRETVFETDNTERCFFHFQTHLRTCRMQELEFWFLCTERKNIAARNLTPLRRLLPHVRCCQCLQWAQEIIPYGNISVESVSLNTFYIHAYLTIHEVWAHLCNYRVDELTTSVTKLLGLIINLMRDNMFAIYEINIISF